MAAQSEYFYSYYVKNIQQFFWGSNKKIEFSEGLLRTLCYETDIGAIPRGIDLDVRMNKPKYMDSTNWNFPIQGCYWCSETKTNLFGICCSKECFFYFHDWCIERVEFLTQRRFCRFPGCDSACMNSSYCNTTHRDEFGKEFHKWVNQTSLSNKILRNGPSWYNSEIKVGENPAKNIPKEFRDYLIFQTDIGIIPREKPSEQQLASPYSLYPNWKKEIRGCYCCGDKLSASTGNYYVCSYSCYLIFYEWCRRKIKSFTGITLCKFPGCMKPSQADFDYCNNEHAQKIEEEYARVKKIKNIETLVERDPDWYIPHHISSNLAFAWKLTNFLYYLTDVGPIPREILPLMPPPHKIVDSNWNAEIPKCYWCCTHPKKISVTCSNKCLFLFNEWIHIKYTKLSKRKLCKYFGCDSYSSLNSQCCTQTHSLKYDKFKEFRPLLKSTEFALGPKWYDDAETTHIDFYNSDEPFYEFTNFYNCDKLFVDPIYWTTTEHTFQGNKFVGTPLMTYVSSLDTPRKAFDFARIPMVQPWIRPDWHSIKTQVMLSVLRHKFVQNPDLADILNRTGEKQIFEHTRNDKFWGDGGDRRGANKLGELLMKVRSELRMSTPYLPNTLNHFPIPDKVDIPPNPTRIPPLFATPNPANVNTESDNQGRFQTGQPTNPTPIPPLFATPNPANVNTESDNQGKFQTGQPTNPTPIPPLFGAPNPANVNTETGSREKFNAYLPTSHIPTSVTRTCNQLECNLISALTDVSHHEASYNVMIGSDMRHKSDGLSHHNISNTSQTTQPDPTNFTVQYSLNPQPNPISNQLINISANQSSMFEAVIVPFADQTYPDVPEGVQATSGDTNEESHDSASVVLFPPGSKDGMQ